MITDRGHAEGDLLNVGGWISIVITVVGVAATAWKFGARRRFRDARYRDAHDRIRAQILRSRKAMTERRRPVIGIARHAIRRTARHALRRHRARQGPRHAERRPRRSRIAGVGAPTVPRANPTDVHVVEPTAAG